MPFAPLVKSEGARIETINVFAPLCTPADGKGLTKAEFAGETRGETRREMFGKFLEGRRWSELKIRARSINAIKNIPYCESAAIFICGVLRLTELTLTHCEDSTAETS